MFLQFSLCCSNKSITRHYVAPKDMFRLWQKRTLTNLNGD